MKDKFDELYEKMITEASKKPVWVVSRRGNKGFSITEARVFDNKKELISYIKKNFKNDLPMLWEFPGLGDIGRPKNFNGKKEFEDFYNER